MSQFRKVTTGYNQTLPDVAIQEGGCMEYLLDIITDNKLPDILPPAPGTVLLIKKVTPVLNATNLAIAKEYKARALEVATGGKYYPDVVVIADDPEGKVIITEDGTAIIPD